MRRKREKGTRNNTRIAFFFVLFVIGILLISFLLKVIVLLNQSKFDGKNRFTISVSNDKSMGILSLSTYNNKISVLKIKDKGSRDVDLKKYLAVPLDGFLVGSFVNTDDNSTSLMWKTILNYRKIKTNLTIIDIFRILVFTRGVSSSDISKAEIPISLSSLEVDKIVSKYVKDFQIEKEGISIRIVNGTGVGGLGNRLARLITNMGGEVILVSTSEKKEKISSISYVGKKTYTVEKISKMLNFKVVQVKQKSIADVTIVIGENNLSSINF